MHAMRMLSIRKVEVCRALLACRATASYASCTSAPGSIRRKGKVVSWHPFERQGTIVEERSGEEYIIANARAFETVLPTMLRSLEGALVEFDADLTPDADRVITRKRLEPITARSYELKPPVDFLAPFLHPKTEGDDGATPHDSRVVYAKNIIADMSSIRSDQLVRCSGPLVDMDVVPPTSNLKDLRSSRLFDKATNEYLAVRRCCPSEEEARELLRKKHEAQGAEEGRYGCGVPRRSVVAERTFGLVLAWSSLHRSGVIAEGLVEMPEDAAVTANNATNMCVIRSVHCFQSALPTSNRLMHRRVTFDKVTYSSMPGKFFAENIVVEGKLGYDDSTRSTEDAAEAKRKEMALERRKRQLGTHFHEDEGGVHQVGSAAYSEKMAEEEGPIPEGAVYGVVTRWSGGQGIVESGNGRMYYIESGASFIQLVDQNSHTIRGAVVTFHVDPNQRTYAINVDIVSSATTTVMETQPLLGRVPGRRMQQQRSIKPDADAAAPLSTIEDDGVGPEGAEWSYGTLITWSPAEGQGIIHGDDGIRYVLRDTEENVFRYAHRKHQLKKGRKLKFTPYGATGKLACNVVVLETEATEEEIIQEDLRPQEPQLSLDGNMNEAVASPMSTSYWLNRMDRAGYDTSEVKQLQNRALTLDEDDGNDGTEGGKFLDSEDLFKKDSWWNDPRKNVHLPNSDITAGHLALMGPASMMNMAMKTKDPKKLEKMSQKYQARLSEEQKEYAWAQAKQMAPKYESLIKKAREHNEEPTFYFF